MKTILALLRRLEERCRAHHRWNRMAHSNFEVPDKYELPLIAKDQWSYRRKLGSLSYQNVGITDDHAQIDIDGRLDSTFEFERTEFEGFHIEQFQN